MTVVCCFRSQLSVVPRLTRMENTGRGEIEEYVNGDGLPWITKYLCVTWEYFLKSADKLMVDLHLYELLDEAAIYLAQHPLVALSAIAIALSCGIPICIFILFAIITVIFTFAGFIVIEGTLLTIGSVLLCGFVLAILLVLVVLMATVGIAYLGLMEVYGLLHNSPDNSPQARFVPNYLARKTQHTKT